ncbi:MAG: hypothetical protein EAZ55_14860 [Cytophagales bacterium]|nr:MAG: hypothetical protein EAZ55_14860 [Cytophagales bacterium]
MKKILSIFVFTVSISMVMSQNSQSILYGIWEGRISSDPNSTQIYYNLINQPQLLSITTDRGKIIALGENFVGFASNQKDTLSLNELKNKGIFFCICSKQDTLFLCDYPKFNIFDSTYFTNGTDVFDYDKIQSLSMDMQRQLLQLSKIKKTNYFKIYLNKEMKLVKVKSTLHDDFISI